MDQNIQTQRIRIPFTKEEDERLTQLVRIHGENWEIVSASMQNGRTPRQCRERWVNWINVSFVKETWSPAEDARLVQKVEEIGPHWKAMEPFFPGRVSYTLRNRFAKLQKMKKRLGTNVHDDLSHQISNPVTECTKNDKKQNEGSNLVCQKTNICSNGICPSSGKTQCKSSKSSCKTSKMSEIPCCSSDDTCPMPDDVCTSSENICTSNNEKVTCCKKRTGVFDNISNEEEGFDWGEGSWCRCTCSSNIP